jgi:hypothetical protein
MPKFSSIGSTKIVKLNTRHALAISALVLLLILGWRAIHVEIQTPTGSTGATSGLDKNQTLTSIDTSSVHVVPETPFGTAMISMFAAVGAFVGFKYYKEKPK